MFVCGGGYILTHCFFIFEYIWANSHVFPKQIYLRGFNGVVLTGLGWSGATGAAAVTRKRGYLHDLVMPGQKTFRGIDKTEGTVHFC